MDLLGAVPRMLTGCCSHLKMQQVSLCMNYTSVALEDLFGQRPVGQWAKVLCSVLDGSSPDKAFHTSARNEHLRPQFISP